VRIGLILPQFSGDAHRVLAAARAAEDLGYDGVFAFDHFFPPGAPADRASLEAFATLGAVGAATERVAVGTLVARASLRPVGMLAKLAASLDDVSAGRLILALGTGDAISAQEHERFGLPSLGVSGRRAHLTETVRAVRALLAGEPWPGGEYVGPVAGPILPPPVRPGGPPLWVGGYSDAAVRIAAAEADGWNGWGVPGPAFATKAALLAEAAGAAGRSVEPTWAGLVVVGRDAGETARLMRERSRRDLAERDVWAGTTSDLLAWLEGLRAAGATWAVLLLGGPADRAEVVATSVLPQLRAGS
jgi:alkanesulfonate monooxygenase SsuD/methylene tetrahydromethanopterin reductase-like flavin-dependent oxidoreductase (luciferase family)